MANNAAIAEVLSGLDAAIATPGCVSCRNSLAFLKGWVSSANRRQPNEDLQALADRLQLLLDRCETEPYPGSERRH
ncbi:hypothetical protein NO559_07890 [Dasania sp. GY-MA-18]|uniref:Uncharacterized protein n=1 Tax=Dasania phycosphaerae TaxID=2950436 RepID=A0A9J6RMA9_9GAMM|nr:MULTISPECIES: hypothetical protein [Dasania]MCR8922687.1 hypothetical protein [Dasania sp. GY-MA-18]MCZ0865117.1 hypothetical protein [Dasania phycosphaerae]MCZ0868843.1 hypothetical protein [Dasania phycosphaerae]